VSRLRAVRCGVVVAAALIRTRPARDQVRRTCSADRSARVEARVRRGDDERSSTAASPATCPIGASRRLALGRCRRAGRHPCPLAVAAATAHSSSRSWPGSRRGSRPGPGSASRPARSSRTSPSWISTRRAHRSLYDGADHGFADAFVRARLRRARQRTLRRRCVEHPVPILSAAMSADRVSTCGGPRGRALVDSLTPLPRCRETGRTVPRRRLQRHPSCSSAGCQVGGEWRAPRPAGRRLSHLCGGVGAGALAGGPAHHW